jgi:uncharacterized membrane protein YgcG
MKSICIISIFIILVLTFSCDNKKSSAHTIVIGDRIFDKADLLTTVQEDSVFSLIKSLESEVGSQIGVLTIDTLGGQKIQELSFRIVDSLRLGRSTHNDGILLTIALKDHAARIDVGTGLENIIKDEIAAQIIRDDMAPNFRDQKFGQGIYRGVDRICKLIRDNKELVGQKPK